MLGRGKPETMGYADEELLTGAMPICARCDMSRPCAAGAPAHSGVPPFIAIEG